MSAYEVVVGFDESPAGRAALEWAGGFAARTGGPLRAVHVLSWPYGPDQPAPWHQDSATELAQLDSTYRADIRAAYDAAGPAADWTLEFADGDAGPVLVRRSARAAALVLGTPQHVGLSRVVAGSVAHHCLNRATTPVIAVPPPGESDEAAPTPPTTGEPTEILVVGIDSSTASIAALRWAAAYARMTGLQLRALHAAPTTDSTTESVVAVEGLFTERAPMAGWELEVVGGAPGPALVAAAATARLLVVGTRRQRGIDRLVHPSVSHFCLSRSPCPMVAVPPGITAAFVHDPSSPEIPRRTP